MTPQETIFIKEMAATGDQTYAATKAGYTQPRALGSKLMTRPAVKAAVETEFRGLLEETVLLGMRRFKKMLEDPRTPNRDVVGIMRVTTTAYRAETVSDSGNRDPAEMTSAEIHQRLESLQREAAARAKPILEGELVEDDSQVDDPEDSVFG